MTSVPQLSDLPQAIGRPIADPDWAALLQAIVNFLGSGNYNAVFSTLTATNFVGIPDFNITGIAGESIAKGNAVRMLAADGKMYKATNASIAGISNYIGIAQSTVITGDSLTVSTRTYTEFSGLTTGALYYVGSSGAITTSTPTTFFQLAGVATSSTSLIILPSYISRLLIGASGTTAFGDFTVDGPTFFVDSTNNRVGVGTITPSTAFQTKFNDTNGNEMGLTSSGASNFSGIWTNCTTGQMGLDILLGGSVFDTYRMARFSQSTFCLGTNNTTYYGVVNSIHAGSSANTRVLRVSGGPGTGTDGGIEVRSVTSGGASTTAAALYVDKDGATSRSINAGGTINASGADYAEYIRKSDTCGEIKKGDICGINDKGELTDKFSESISFAIKSTNPSYVGGDIWGNEERLCLKEPIKPVKKDDESDEDFYIREREYEETVKYFLGKLEEERRRYDRIAFSGVVPFNQDGGSPGDYAIPSQNPDDSIGCEFFMAPTFDQYIKCVGRVISKTENEKAKLVVKIS